MCHKAWLVLHVWTYSEYASAFLYFSQGGGYICTDSCEESRNSKNITHSSSVKGNFVIPVDIPKSANFKFDFMCSYFVRLLQCCVWGGKKKGNLNYFSSSSVAQIPLILLVNSWFWRNVIPLPWRKEVSRTLLLGGCTRLACVEQWASKGIGPLGGTELYCEMSLWISSPLVHVWCEWPLSVSFQMWLRVFHRSSYMSMISSWPWIRQPSVANSAPQIKITSTSIKSGGL